MKYIWIFLTIIFRVSAGVCAKKAALQSAGGELYEMVFNFWYLAALVFLSFQALFWIIVLRNFELSFAYPFMSITIIFNIIVANLIFKETILTNHLIGASLIGIGVFVLQGSIRNHIKN